MDVRVVVHHRGGYLIAVDVHEVDDVLGDQGTLPGAGGVRIQ